MQKISRSRKLLAAVLAFSLLEGLVQTAAAASPGNPSGLGWEAPLSLIVFGYACYQGARLLLLTPRRRLLLAFLTAVCVALCLAAVVPLRRLQEGSYSVTIHKAARTLELFRGPFCSPIGLLAL